jgi:hypothetical protein
MMCENEMEKWSGGGSLQNRAVLCENKEEDFFFFFLFLFFSLKLLFLLGWIEQMEMYLPPPIFLPDPPNYVFAPKIPFKKRFPLCVKKIISFPLPQQFLEKHPTFRKTFSEIFLFYVYLKGAFDLREINRIERKTRKSINEKNIKIDK